MVGISSGIGNSDSMSMKIGYSIEDTTVFTAKSLPSITQPTKNSPITRKLIMNFWDTGTIGARATATPATPPVRMSKGSMKYCTLMANRKFPRAITKKSFNIFFRMFILYSFRYVS